MRAPKLKNLKIDIKGTEKMRARAAKFKKIKITINVDEDLLHALKIRSEESGVPYQTLLNKMLRASMDKNHIGSDLSRLERLEKEVALLKRKISA